MALELPSVPGQVPRAAFWHSSGCSHTDVGRGGSGLTSFFVTAPDPSRKFWCIEQSSPSLQIRGYIQVAVLCEGKDSLVGTWELKAEKDINRASTLKFLLTTLYS